MHFCVFTFFLKSSKCEKHVAEVVHSKISCVLMVLTNVSGVDRFLSLLSFLKVRSNSTINIAELR